MDSIVAHAEEFAETGMTVFNRWELKAWFRPNRTNDDVRLGKNVWRQLRDHIHDKAPGATIKVVDMGDRYIFINNQKVQTLSSWTG